MMKNVVLAFLLLCSAGARGGEGYQATVDLTAMVDDRLPVALTLPDITEREVIFVFPKVSPGTYDKSDFGRFVREFQVLDAAGAPLPVKQLDKNAYRITDATNARTVRYWLEDSWEEGRGAKYVFQPGGTNFEKGKNFVLNHHGMFGYVQGYKNRPFEVTYKKPDGFYGATALPREAAGPNEDRFRAATYFELADNPILYCVPDTVSYDESGVRINIAVYAATGQTKASLLLPGIRKATRAIRTEFPDMPLDSYSFLFYLFDVKSPVFKRGGYAAGALEHHRSSLYYLPDIYVPADSARLMDDLLEVVTHEFLHIITPLNLHSERIADFDFYNPVMSQHLWL
ncbi:MAG: peptidase M61, partial [Bacteroidota bacterium]